MEREQGREEGEREKKRERETEAAIAAVELGCSFIIRVISLLMTAQLLTALASLGEGHPLIDCDHKDC